jgi:AhpD family alkylhydroperoxidase
MNRQDVSRETQQFFGFVPGFIQSLPDQHVGALWESMRRLQLEQGVIPPKYQQLTMLAVATYAKCKYCTDFHTEVARTLGATNQEIAETALLVGHTALWSNILGGTQYDFEVFKKEVRNACKNLANSVEMRDNGGRGARA